MSGGSTPIGILPVDDHPIVREGIAGVPGFSRSMTMVTLMDIQIPEMNGLDALIAIRTGFSDAVHRLPISQIGLIASLIRGHRVPSTRTSETPWPVRIRVAAHDASSPTQISSLVLPC
jgi:hypothetical protein